MQQNITDLSRDLSPFHTDGQDAMRQDARSLSVRRTSPDDTTSVTASDRATSRPDLIRRVRQSDRWGRICVGQWISLPSVRLCENGLSLLYISLRFC